MGMRDQGSGQMPGDRKRPVGAGLPSWNLQDAKARFSEVVRLARERGPRLDRFEDSLVRERTPVRDAPDFEK